MHRSVAINVNKLVMSFGSYRALSDLFVTKGFKPITIQGIYKWSDRGRIPGDRLLEIAKICDETGRRFRLTDYIINGECTNA